MTGESQPKDVKLWKQVQKEKTRISNRQKYAIKVHELQIERHRTANESIATLLTVVRYLNEVQDGDALRIEGDFSKTAIDKPSRILNCHEEDIMNASLITMKRLIETLLPTPSRQRKGGETVSPE